MRRFLGILGLFALLTGSATAQDTATTPYTFAASPTDSQAEICRGAYLYVVTAGGAPQSEVLYLLDALRAQPDHNVRIARFLVDGYSVQESVENDADGDGVGMLFVALRDPSQGGTVTLHVSVNGATYTNTIAVPPAQSQEACANPPFEGAPSLARR